MKGRFSTIDVNVVVKDLQKLLSLRVINVYDVDHKTYLIKLSLPDNKAVLVIESGIRIHSTEFEWPKHVAPSGFAMKLRKHLRGRRLEAVHQLGIDRVVDLQFGSSEAAYHVILEMYDRGNIVLTDYNYVILNILRPRSNESEDVKLVVRERYPVSSAKQYEPVECEKIYSILKESKNGNPLKRTLLPATDFGPALIEHCLLSAGFSDAVKINDGFHIDTDFDKLMNALEKAAELFQNLSTQKTKGYIIQKRDMRPATKGEETKELLTYDEFHPYLFCQYEKRPYLEMDSFDKAVDEFFSKLETQKLDMKILQQEKIAVKKLENVKKDHEKRMQELQKVQELDTLKGQFIEYNLTLVDQAIRVVRSALANQINWTEISELLKQAQLQQDPVACSIKSLKLETNHITMHLNDPYIDSDEEEDEQPKSLMIDIDLGLSAYANSKKYFDNKRQAAKKEQKTIHASAKALKSAERKTKETLKDVATAATINKARKTHWFEKFLWFISSENYVVVGGRDQQQNEILVKKYLRPGDLYVHADLHGASSVVIKNHTVKPVPPKTLNEAGSMAICNSAAWDAKVITSAWWVYHDQVSKTAPTGEYLTTGSFMIRGKKNYLPPSYLVYGFGLLFKLEEGSVFRHAGERKVREVEEEDVIEMTELDADKIASMDDSSQSEGSEDETNADQEQVKVQKKSSDDVDAESISMSKINKDNESKSVHWSKETEEAFFPDTTISLKYSGEKLTVNKVHLDADASSDVMKVLSQVQEEKKVKDAVKGGRMSAKARRDLRKSKRQGHNSAEMIDQEKTEVTSSTQLKEDLCETNSENLPLSTVSSVKQEPLKRGKRNKLKKIKEKYKDQDEEERLLCMELLASSGPAKESKKKKKQKDSAPKTQQKLRGHIPEKLKMSTENPVIRQTAELSETTNETKTDEMKTVKEKLPNDNQDEESDEDKMDEEDLTQQATDAQVLDSLTGCPVAEDELLYSICVVAPYNTLLNYKYKVKLLPGSTKRGKASKTALAMFSQDKTASSREKDLIKILKDCDISRNIPGKVKLAAPNLQKQKKQK
ncbi:Hypothetical predicted protein [Octopus vulgaris]|uniref:Nuclear export mediator factor NEMF n=1 Tax=Octopus vulgaris TaxID=6645 RepID=A0AA36BB18_OCTVU|nr:Hypothetical predicted protein [Octopus vulgaris]